MRNDIHPKYNQGIKITCVSCGKVYTVGSTKDAISVELCSNCHPYYTGKENVLIDRDNMVDKFNKRLLAAKANDGISRRKKKQQRAGTAAYSPEQKLTLKDMLKKSQR